MSSARETPIWQLLQGTAPGTALLPAVRKREAWLPCFLAEADTVPAGPRPYHNGSVLAHTARCMDAVAGDAVAVWMALVHDAGKLTTPHALWPHHYGHEARGKQLASVWARQLGLPDMYARVGALAALLHMKAGRYELLRPGKKFDLLHTLVASGFFTPFWKMVDADTRSAVSKAATLDWQRICLLSYDGTHEKTRQIGISMLKKVKSGS